MTRRQRQVVVWGLLSSLVLFGFVLGLAWGTRSMFGQRCEDRGYKPNTYGYDDCVTKLAKGQPVEGLCDGS